MKYEVVRYFTDMQDNDFAYHEGDTYPRDGLNPSEQRIKDLMNGNNFQKVTLIVPKKSIKAKEQPKEQPKEEVVWSKEDIEKMPFMKLKSVAKKNGIEVADRKADEIRSELIEKLIEE